MFWKDTINLITMTATTNDSGDSIPSESSKTVFANKKSVRQSEFYQAMAIGLKPELMFETRKSDYSGQEWLDFESTRYQIIRTYSKNDEIVELVCKSKVT